MESAYNTQPFRREKTSHSRLVNLYLCSQLSEIVESSAGWMQTTDTKGTREMLWL